MKLFVPNHPPFSPQAALQKSGYSHFVDPNTGKESYVLRLTRDYYPRFHVYLKAEHDQIVIDLHLDQKKPSYGTNHAHSGEYDGPTVEREMERIKTWVKHSGGNVEMNTAAAEQTDEEQPVVKEDRGLFGGIF